MNELTCTACKILIGFGRDFITSPTELETIFDVACSKFRVETSRVCHGLGKAFAPQMFYILKHSNMSINEMCSVVQGIKCGGKHGNTQNTNWTVPLPSKTSEQTPLKAVAKRATKVLHLSDLHIDLYYQPESSSDCGEPLCCRATSQGGTTRAGFWGDYVACDSPQRTIVNLLDHINRTQVDYDYLIWTGDISPHDVWNYSRESLVTNTRTLSTLIKTYLSPEDGRKLVFPVLGNHEGYPVDQ